MNGHAWVYDVHEEASPRTIDWEQFEAASPNPTSYSGERFFRWRCWFDYGTGLAGDLLSHEYDAVNQILEVGIPETAMSSGGVYFYKDGRDVPDTFQVAFEYPERSVISWCFLETNLMTGKPRATRLRCEFE